MASVTQSIKNQLRLILNYIISSLIGAVSGVSVLHVRNCTLRFCLRLDLQFVDEFGIITLTDQYGRPREDLEGMIEPTEQQILAMEMAEHQMELEQQERERQMELEEQKRQRQMELEEQRRQEQLELEEQKQQLMLEMEEQQAGQTNQADPVLNAQQEQFLLRFLRTNPSVLTNFLQSLGASVGPKGEITQKKQQA